VWSVRSAWFQPPCPRRVPQLASTLGAPCVAANPQSPLPRKTRSSPPPRPAGRPSRRILALDCASCGANGRMTRIVRPLVRASLCISSLCKPAELFVVVTKMSRCPIALQRRQQRAHTAMRGFLFLETERAIPRVGIQGCFMQGLVIFFPR